MDPTAEKECRLLSPGTAYQGKQALNYVVGISAETAGAIGIHMQLVTIPPGGRAEPHMHEAHETAIYTLSGTSHVLHGQLLEHHDIVPPGSFYYIPAGVPHLPYNPNETEPVVTVIARTDPNEQENVVLLPHLGAVATSVELA